MKDMDSKPFALIGINTNRYNVEKLMAEHWDAKLTDLLATIANCPKARSVSIHDRCKPAKDQGDNSNLERHPASLSR